MSKSKFVIQETITGEFLKKGGEYEGVTTDRLKEARVFFTPKSAKHAAKHILKTEHGNRSWLVQDKEVVQTAV